MVRNLRESGQVYSSTDSDNANMLPACLRENALEAYRKLPDDVKLDLGKLRTKLAAKFESPELRQVLGEELMKRKQRLSETVDAYANEVLRLTRLGYPNMTSNERDRFAKDVFVRGLSPKYQKRQVSMPRCSSRSDAKLTDGTPLINRLQKTAVSKVTQLRAC